jgi:hypothetical protein
MKSKAFDLTGVRFVKRIVIGTSDPAAPMTEEEISAALVVLNRCISESPRGWIVGMEKNFAVISMGEHQVVLQWLVYHVGFARKPVWLEEKQ